MTAVRLFFLKSNICWNRNIKFDTRKRLREFNQVIPEPFPLVSFISACDCLICRVKNASFSFPVWFCNPYRLRPCHWVCRQG